MVDDTQAPASKNGLLDHSAFWLHRLSSAVLNRFETSLRETDVTVAQWKVMVVLYRREASTAFSVASVINVDAGSVTRVVDRLVAKGLVDRTPSADDRRATELNLTPSGIALLEKELLPIADAQDNSWLETLSPAELLVFKGLLSRLLAAQDIDTPQTWARSGLCTDLR